MYHIFCINFSVVGHMGYFHLMVITNKAIVNIIEYMSLWYDVGIFWVYAQECYIWVFNPT